MIDPFVAGLPYGSCRWTEIVPLEIPAVEVRGAVRKTSAEPFAGVTVACWVAEVSAPDPSAAVIVGLPAAVSRYLKLALELPSGIETEVIVTASARSRNEPPDELVRFTVAVPPVVGLPAVSSRSTMIVPVVAPAVIVRGGVLNTSFVAVILTALLAVLDLQDRQTAATV